MPRRQFRLPAEDEEYLDCLGLAWETIIDGGSRWLLVHDAPVASGYCVPKAIEAYLIDPNYPETQIDMVFFYPALRRQDGKQINCADCMQYLDGKQFQRWSRHRTAENQWRRGIDDISTHRALVRSWQEREFKLR